jgi:hypothetical protein
MGMYVMGVNLTGMHLIGVYLMGVHLIDVYIMVFCDPPSNVKIGIDWVVVKEVPTAEVRSISISTAARSDEVGIFQN